MGKNTQLDLRNADASASLRIQYAEPPAELPSAAKKLWRPMVEMLGRAGLLYAMDLFALERLCLAYADYVDATEELDRNIVPIKRGGKITEYRRSKYYTIVDKEGNVIHKRHPAAEDQAEADKRMLNWLREFGLTPSSRKSWLRPSLASPLDNMAPGGGASGFEGMSDENRDNLRKMLEEQALNQRMAMQRGNDIEDAEIVEPRK